MGNTKSVFFLLLLLALSSAPSMYAHHGYAGYDLTATVTISGTVTELSVANPHSMVRLDVKDEKGEVGHWAVEFGDVRGLTSQGWTQTTLKPGDEIKLTCHQAKNGARVGALVGKITYADGRPLPLNPPAQ